MVRDFFIPRFVSKFVHMEGIGRGLGEFIFFTCFFIISTPIITIVALKEIGIFKKISSKFKIFLAVVLFLSFALLTILLIRTKQFSSIDGLFFYNLSLGFILGIHFTMKKYKKGKTTKLPNDSDVYLDNIIPKK
jgi:glucan phosphoethanolaminetransferase (alkaline phosphatase superfamily)